MTCVRSIDGAPRGTSRTGDVVVGARNTESLLMSTMRRTRFGEPPGELAEPPIEVIPVRSIDVKPFWSYW
jgi:hypothetical protein